MSGGVSRVSIPVNLKKTIQDIKEIAGKHNDDDIYAMLRECNMDPNETAQKLLYLDTFHEVKRKRDKKANVNNRAYEDPAWASGMQRRGTKGYGGGREGNARWENGYKNYSERSSNPPMPGSRRKEHDAVPATTKSSAASSNHSAGVSNRSSGDKAIPQSSALNFRAAIGGAPVFNNNKLADMPSLPAVAVKQLRSSNTGMPSNTPTGTAETRSENGYLKLMPDHLGNPVGSPSVSGLYSSATDPILVPSLNPRHPAAVGTIKRETGNQRVAAEVRSIPLAGSSINAGQTVTGNQAFSGTVGSTSHINGGLLEVEQRNSVEPSLIGSSNNHNVSSAGVTDEKTPPVRQVNGPTKVGISEAAHYELEADMHSALDLNGSTSKQATSGVDTMLHKLHLSDRQSVIFPDHLFVPEALKNGLTFGSLDAPSVESTEATKPVDVGVQTNFEAAEELSPTHQSGLSDLVQVEYTDHTQPPPQGPEKLTPLQDNSSSGTVPSYDETKVEMLQSTGGSLNPLLPSMTDYKYGLVPPAVGTHPAQFEGFDPQGGNSTVQSTVSTTLPGTASGLGQSSIAIPPHLFPFLRQPYPPHYLSYNPYLSQLYMHPQNAHQFLGHGAFPQQPSTGNVYIPPTASGTGVKIPVPPLYKSGSIPGNLTHFGVPSGYGSFGTPGVAYSSGAALAPGISGSNDDVVGPDTKEKKGYATVKQIENPHEVASAVGRDTSAMQANIFYNLPPGQHLTFSPAQVAHGAYPGIYHPTQTMLAPSTHPSLLQHQQSQAMPAPIESIIPPLGAYLDPQSHLQPQPQNPQMNWNPKLVKRENV